MADIADDDAVAVKGMELLGGDVHSIGRRQIGRREESLGRAGRAGCHERDGEDRKKPSHDGRRGEFASVAEALEKSAFLVFHILNLNFLRRLAKLKISPAPRAGLRASRAGFKRHGKRD